MNLYLFPVMNIALFSVVLTLLPILTMAQRPDREPAPDALDLSAGVSKMHAGAFSIGMGVASGVVVNLNPKSLESFDFLPADRLEQRSGEGFAHLGDVTLRVRSGSGEWREMMSYRGRAAAVPVDGGNGALAVHDISAGLGEDLPVQVLRRWELVEGHLRLMFEVKNTSESAIELGAFGMAMPFNNIIVGRSLEEAHAVCSFTDPYIGGDAGYLRVTRLDGVGPTMVVTPVGDTPFEAWRLIQEPMRPNQVFEGMMEWTVHSKAFAETDWEGVEQWVEPSSVTIAPGATRTYGVQFTMSPSIRAIEDTLVELGRPVAVGIPGYILPQDQTGKLFLKYGSPVEKISVHPEGAVKVAKNSEGKNGWSGYSMEGVTWGRSRLTVSYADGTDQVINTYVIKPSTTTVGDLGRFLTNEAWFDDEDDPFGRYPAVISYDREADAQVKQDPRVWIAGMGDEGGSGNWLALAMKQFGQPVADEVEKLEAFVLDTMWGNLQFSEGPNRFGVRKSIFYYEPDRLPNFPYNKDFNWGSWTSWSWEHSNDIGRGYNYPHVVAAYWSMYRLARNYPHLVKRQDWDWYLNQAYQTLEFMTSQRNGRDVVGYWRLGLMDGSVFVSLLADLKREGWDRQADLIQERMAMRANRWKDEPFPFRSEMAWDSTGQEEVYMWCKWFGYEDKAQVTLNSILAYDPTVPHWGYNGNARRYWDFLYAGKLSRIERQIHHYGSGLNAIPLLNEFREHPDDLYLLRVGYGGTMGALSNIDEGGFASAAFHSFPSTLKWDAYSGDYGPNFFGHAYNICTYLVETEDFGWQVFGGSMDVKGSTMVVRPLDSFRKRVYLAPIGLYLTLDAGTFESVTYDLESGKVTLALSGIRGLRQARLVVEHPSEESVEYVTEHELREDIGAYVVPLINRRASVTLVPR